MLKEKLENIKKNGSSVEREIKQRTAGYIIGGFGLVAALAWNDAIRSLIDAIFPIDKNNLSAKFAYALLITAVVTVATLLLVRMQSPKDNDKA